MQFGKILTNQNINEKDIKPTTKETLIEVIIENSSKNKAIIDNTIISFCKNKNTLTKHFLLVIIR